jgi:hypothetical protein
MQMQWSYLAQIAVNDDVLRTGEDRARERGHSRVCLEMKHSGGLEWLEGIEKHMFLYKSGVVGNVM